MKLRTSRLPLALGFLVTLLLNFFQQKSLLGHLSAPDDAPSLQSSGFVPHWEVRDDVVPYMGNLTCPFELAHWNLDSHKHPEDVERRRNCGKMRFKPHAGWTAPDPTVVFERFAHNATIAFIGDSITMQAGVDFMCAIASMSEIVKSDITRLPGGYWCTKERCEVDYQGFGQIYWIHATFRSYNNAMEGGNGTDIHVSMVSEQKGQKNLLLYLAKLTRGDLIVMNQGLHYLNDSPMQENLLEEYEKIKLPLLDAKGKGVHLVWRETNAAHISDGNSTDGYYVEGQPKPIVCVPSSKLNATWSKQRSHGRMVSFMESLGIPLVEVWEATFLLPEYCHVGQGKDCLHFLQPGGATTFMTEALLKHIEEFL